MNQRLYNLSKWTFLPEGESLDFINPKPRIVILEVNAPSEVALYIMQLKTAVEAARQNDYEAGRNAFPAGGEDPFGKVTDGDTKVISFLALVKGRDRVEFAVDGEFELLSEGGPVYVYTADGLDVATRIVEPFIFTRLANRRQRNPELEMMMYQQRLNQERFKAEVNAEADRRVGALEKKLEAYATQRDIRAPDERIGKPGGAGEAPLGGSSEPESGSGKGSPPAKEGGAGSADTKPAKGVKTPPDGG